LQNTVIMTGCNKGPKSSEDNPSLTAMLVTALPWDRPFGFPEGEPSGTEHFLGCPALLMRRSEDL
jgi:hypothetical protein